MKRSKIGFKIFTMMLLVSVGLFIFITTFNKPIFNHVPHETFYETDIKGETLEIIIYDTGSWQNRLYRLTFIGSPIMMLISVYPMIYFGGKVNEE